MNESYQYQALATPSTIRLIKILPDQVMGDIVCTIHHFDRAITPNLNYHAVSYRWGDPKPTKRIRLGDTARNTHSYPLHENLWQLLNYLWQQKTFDRFYWTDSLCLRQEDTQEISEQVPRMGEIYSAAEKVLVWLGHEKEGEDALKLVRDWPGPVDWGLVDIDNEEEVERANAAELMRDEVEKAALYLLLLPYWSRVWIVQEVVLAKKAYISYGNISLDIDDFRSKVDHFRQVTPELNYQPTVWSLCDLRQAGAKKPLWEVLTEFNYCASSKTIDKVYGFLGLVADRENGTSPAQLIEVNKDKEPYEVFWDTVFECCAPWNKYSRVILSLGQLLRERGESRANWDFRTLEQYASAARTSERHVRFAKIALCVFDAAHTIRMLTGVEFQEWTKAINSVLSSAMQIPCEFTELQNTAAVGLAFTAVRSEVYPIWKDHWKQVAVQGVNSSFQWRCAAHQAEEGSLGFASNYSLQNCPKAQIGPGRRIPRRECSRSSTCSGSIITFETEDVDFRVVFLSDVNTEVIGGTIFLDIEPSKHRSLINIGSRLRGQEAFELLILVILLFSFVFLGYDIN